MKGNLIFGIVAKNEPESAAHLHCPLQNIPDLVIDRYGRKVPRVFANTFPPARRTSKIPHTAAHFAENPPRVRFTPTAPYGFSARHNTQVTSPRQALPRPAAHTRAGHSVFPQKLRPRHAHTHRATRVPPHKSRAPEQLPFCHATRTRTTKNGTPAFGRRSVSVQVAT